MRKSVWFILIFTLVLSIFFVNAAVDQTVEVTFANQDGSCRMAIDNSDWLDTNGQSINYTVLGGISVGDCFLKDPNSGNYFTENVSCCPSNWDACVETDTYPGGRCVQDIGLCENIGASGSCENANPSIAQAQLGVQESDLTIGRNDPVTGEICYDYLTAKCIWKINDTTDQGSCVASTINIENINDSVNGTCSALQTIGTCIYEITNQTSFCDTIDQIIVINYSAEIQINESFSRPPYANESWCADNSQIYSCSASIQLPAFGFFNFFVSILGIGAVYFLFKKNYKEKA